MGKRLIALMLVGLLGLGLTLAGCEQEGGNGEMPTPEEAMEEAHEGADDMHEHEEGMHEEGAEEEAAPEGTAY
jgi:hypothetical protein